MIWHRALSQGFWKWGKDESGGEEVITAEAMDVQSWASSACLRRPHGLVTGSGSVTTSGSWCFSDPVAVLRAGADPTESQEHWRYSPTGTSWESRALPSSSPGQPRLCPAKDGDSRTFSHKLSDRRCPTCPSSTLMAVPAKPCCDLCDSAIRPSPPPLPSSESAEETEEAGNHFSAISGHS